ncbi:MAG: TraB/GumN family protein [Gammaproteobacteria bacterium]
MLKMTDDQNMNKFFVLTTTLLLSLTFIFSTTVRAELICEPLVLAEQKQIVPDRHAKGLLWKISRIGLQPSYLFGTMHLPDKEITTLSRPVLDALDNALSVTLEVKFDPELFQDISKTMNYSDGTTLKGTVGKDLYEDALFLLKNYGFTDELASSLKPWSAYLALSMPPSKGGLPLDMVILNRGKQFGAEIYGLETLDEQLGIFDKMPDEEQKQLLKETVCNYKTFQKDVFEMKDLYLKKDLAGLAFMSEKYEPKEEGQYDELMEDLITKRNLKMAERMQIRLIEGNAFIAVGALHLPGEEGILGLLEEQGFTVEPIF